MSPFKGILVGACLLAGLLAVGPAWSGQAQRAATEAALVDQSTPSQSPLQTVGKQASLANPASLTGP